MMRWIVFAFDFWAPAARSKAPLSLVRSTVKPPRGVKKVRSARARGAQSREPLRLVRR
ncbi:MAG: hypothetical protein QM817_04065 [Archangium sp.]